MRILHLSDTHITGEPGPNANGIDSRESLRRILEACSCVPDISLVLVTGDIADDGSRPAYSAALSQIGAFARERDVPAIFTTGNHDERQAFTDVLGIGHPAPSISFPGTARAAVSTVGGYRIITLDSLVPGHGHGVISTDQLAWLREVLTQPGAAQPGAAQPGAAQPGAAQASPGGSIVAFHHPPISVPEVRVHRLLGLHNSAELASAVAGTDVRLILCGHFHAQLFGMLAGIPVSVTPGVINRIDDVTIPGAIHAMKGASATLIDLGGPSSPVIHTVRAQDPATGTTAYEVDAATFGALLDKLEADG